MPVDFFVLNNVILILKKDNKKINKFTTLNQAFFWKKKLKYLN